jgi:hypothetical protein
VFGTKYWERIAGLAPKKRNKVTERKVANYLRKNLRTLAPQTLRNLKIVSKNKSKTTRKNA